MIRRAPGAVGHAGSELQQLRRDAHYLAVPDEASGREVDYEWGGGRTLFGTPEEAVSCEGPDDHVRRLAPRR